MEGGAMHEEQVRDTTLYGKIYGCLAAGAIGDQLGRPAEGWHYQDVDAKKGRLTDPWEASDRTGGGDTNFDIGTDDTALGQILCHTYIAKGGRIMEREVMRVVPPLFEEGGYIPGCDHGVPPDISWPKFIEYTRLLAKLCGWL